MECNQAIISYKFFFSSKSIPIKNTLFYIPVAGGDFSTRGCCKKKNNNNPFIDLQTQIFHIIQV